MPNAPVPTGPPFLRFNSITGWPLGDRAGIPDIDRALRLAISGRSAVPMSEPTGTFGGRTLPRGLAITSEGRIFLADPSTRVIWTTRVDAANASKPVNAPASWPLVPLWPARPLAQATPHDLAPTVAIAADPYTLLGPTDVTLSPNGDLVILDPAAQRILVLAFPTAALRHVILVDGGAPTAIAFDRRNRAYVADPKLKTIYRYDRNWRRDFSFSPSPTDNPSTPISPVFIAARGADHRGDGPAKCDTGKCSDEEDRRPLPREKPVAYTLDEANKLYALYADGRMDIVTDHTTLALSPTALTLSDDRALLYSDPARPKRDPIRITGLELTADGRHAGTGLPLLARPRRIEVPRSGYFITDAIDATVPGFAWDRIALTLEMPENTRVVLQSFTSDSAIEPDQIKEQSPGSWSPPMALLPGSVPEVLIQSPPGRYLWLRIDLSGDGVRTPVISELDVFGPRRSSLADLPAPFHQDPDSARFLDRFLSYFDTVFSEITHRNREIATLFDPETTPAASGFLTWLGAWFDLQFLAEWDEGTRREMIREAIGYFRMRGTVDGVRKIVQWHTGLPDPLPQIIEHFRLPTEAGDGPPPMIGGQLLNPGSPAHSFTVVLPASTLPDAATDRRLVALIAASIPAHCRFQIRTFTPGITIGSQSSVGVDTLLGSLDPTGLGLGQLGGTFATPGPEPDRGQFLSNSQITYQEGCYRC